MKQKAKLIVICAVLSCLFLGGCNGTSNTGEETPQITITTEDETQVTETEESDTGSDSTETQVEEVASDASQVSIYITLDDGMSYEEVVVPAEELATPEYLIEQMSIITGWNLDLCDTVTSGKGGMTVAFASTSALYVGPPEPQYENFYVFDQYQLTTAILNSIQYTLQHYYVDESLGGDPNSLDIYYCGEGDEELVLSNIGAYVPLTEPYSGLVYETEETSAYLYYPDDTLSNLLQVAWSGSIATEQELYDAWETSALLDTDTQVLSFDGTTLDLSNQFAVLIGNFGTSAETLYIEGLATTFKEYYGLTQLYLTIEGEVLSTGHNIYDGPL